MQTFLANHDNSVLSAGLWGRTVGGLARVEGRGPPGLGGALFQLLRGGALGGIWGFGAEEPTGFLKNELERGGWNCI